MEIVFIITFLILSFWIYMSGVPSHFKPNSTITIEEGEILKSVATKLKENDLIRSETLFVVSMVLQNKDKKIVPGEYLFDKPISIFEIEERITQGKFGFPFKSVILKEGLTLKQMAYVLSQNFSRFDYDLFLEKTSTFEGFYFPDTYIFPENVKTEKVIETLQNTFQLKIKEIEPLINASKRSLDEIIIMASIVEKEATAEARQEVANILWHRIDIKMPLQVDATFVYSIDKHSFNVTKAEMKDKDNPYNTYVHLGLPPTAISNPGIESIKAAANQQPTENLFFLTGMDGEMYYAVTHDEHVKNKAKYLK
jgi:UPF0755 protein